MTHYQSNMVSYIFKTTKIDGQWLHFKSLLSLAQVTTENTCYKIVDKRGCLCCDRKPIAILCPLTGCRLPFRRDGQGIRIQEYLYIRWMENQYATLSDGPNLPPSFSFIHYRRRRCQRCTSGTVILSFLAGREPVFHSQFGWRAIKGFKVGR
jgi:hypothetical protein